MWEVVTVTERPLGERVAALEAIVEAGFREVRGDIRELKAVLERRLDDQERRLSALERWRYYVMGAAAAIGAFVGMAFDWIKGLFKQ